MQAADFRVGETIEESVSNDNFQLHEHNSYEILLFLEGDSKFVIEGKDYFLEPEDIIIIRSHEMHRVYHNSNTKYRRIILHVNPRFFINHNCTNYEAQFLNSQTGIGNRIKSNVTHSSGLYDAFMRLKDYSENYTLETEPVVDSIVMEILYLINRIGRFSTSDVHGGHVEKVISYINTHYTEDINLQTLENEFFISKYHLCKIFKKATGLTVHDYIYRKRLTRVKVLRSEGKSISEAAMLSGFCDYSSFYRAHKKITGLPPKDNI